MRFPFALLILVSIEAKKRPRVNSSMVDAENSNQQLRHNVDVYPGTFPQPVPFGHIFKEGFFDPKSRLKQPIDLLELTMNQPRTPEEAKKIWETRRNEVQVILNEKLIERPRPRNKLLYEQYPIEEGNPKKDKVEPHPWFNWETIQHSNIARHRPNFNPPPSKINFTNIPNEGYDSGPKMEYFEPGSFDLASNMAKTKINWTTCDEFGKSPNFHPKDIVDIDWVPFYVWATMEYHEALVHRFSYPTKKLLKEYKDTYSSHVNATIDWEQPKLILKESLEMLLIAGDRAGMFHAVPHQDLPDYVKNKPIEFPTFTIRMKVKDPYLAMMYCEHQYATIMAVSGNEPPTFKSKIADAAVLKFRGTGYPVYRNIERERMVAEAERAWLAEVKANEEIKIEPPSFRDHFLGRDRK